MVRVMVAGTFDFLHPGHLDLFRQAKELGDELVVVVSRDASAEKTKGQKPLFSEIERLEMVASVRYVDLVRLGNPGDWFAVVKELRPDVLLLGYDQKIDEAALGVFLEKNGLTTRVVRGIGFETYKFKSSMLKKHIGV